MTEITKEVMEQYEAVRQGGSCNMFDITCVRTFAEFNEFDELEAVASDRKLYCELIGNFDKLMKKYDISQEG